MNLEEDFDNLRKEFILVGGQDSSQDIDIDLYARTNVDKVISFKTPSKELSKSGGFNASKLTKTVDSLFAISSIKELNTSMKTEGEENEESVTVSSLAMQVETLQKLISTIAGVVDTVELFLNQKTTLFYGSLQQLKQLEGTLGNYPKMLESKAIEPTIWAVITNIVVSNRMMHEKFDKETKKLMSDLSEVEVKNSSSVEIGIVNEFKNELINTLQLWKVTIEDVQSRVTKVESKAEKYASGRTALSISTSGDQSTSTLLTLLGITPSISSTTRNNHPVPLHTNTSSGDWVDKVSGLRNRITKIEKQQSEHGREGLNESV